MSTPLVGGYVDVRLPLYARKGYELIDAEEIQEATAKHIAEQGKLAAQLVEDNAQTLVTHAIALYVFSCVWAPIACVNYATAVAAYTVTDKAANTKARGAVTWLAGKVGGAVAAAGTTFVATARAKCEGENPAYRPTMGQLWTAIAVK